VADATRQADGAIGSAVLTAGAALLLTLIPVSQQQSAFPALDLGLLVALAVALAPLMLLVAALAAGGDHQLVPARLEAASLWGACGLALLAALAAVAASAESLNLENIVVAQQNTALYVLKQPAAASVYLAAIAVASQPPLLRVVTGPPSRARFLVELLFLAALAALGATLFLGGFAGATLPGAAWVAIKAGVVLTLLLVMRRKLGGLGFGGRLAIAWGAAMVALANLAITLLLRPH
jgi:NADH-quinone oxidoreductase subunit H